MGRVPDEIPQVNCFVILSFLGIAPNTKETFPLM